MLRGSILRGAIAFGALFCAAQMISAQTTPLPPGTVIDHSLASTQKFIGSPSISIQPDGTYVATHDEFGPGSTEYMQGITHVFQSKDRGVSWREVTRINAFWGTLFQSNGILYLIGTNRNSGWVQIVKSSDNGVTWTRPTSTSRGVLLPEGKYQLGPGAVLISGGRVWKAVEDIDPNNWSFGYRAMVMSAPVGSDLLQASNWKISNRVPGVSTMYNSKFGGWLEGNVVASPSGGIVDILRVTVSNYEEIVATLNSTPNGATLSYDKSKLFSIMPGGCKKFTIRYDTVSHKYWTLANRVAPSNRKRDPIAMRNELDLMWSTDLVNWTTAGALDYHADYLYHGFQYADWQFDGNDLVAVVRVAFDDESGGAATFHDANFLTFQRIANFRSWTGAMHNTSP